MNEDGTPEPERHGAPGTSKGAAAAGSRDQAEWLKARVGRPAARLARGLNEFGPVHPALIPGIGVERTGREFRTSPLVFAVSGALIVAVVVWAVGAPATVSTVGSTSLDWVTTRFGWLYGVLAIVITAFMLVLGYGRTGGVRLGADDEKPEFSTVSWVAMLFSAGMGIGLLFYGPYEPLTYFMDLPHGFDAAADSP